jgi:ABC-2 type transport system ATP-binding protein
MEARAADVIAAEGLTKSYGASRGVVELTFAVEAGEVFGFLGPNGAGKSTTIRTMLDFIRPTSGAISVFGLEPGGPRDPRPHRLHAR